MGEQLHSGAPTEARYALTDASPAMISDEWLRWAESLCAARPASEREALLQGLSCREGRAPSRDRLLQFCLGARATVNETQRLLLLAQRPALYPRIRRDAAILFCIMGGYAPDSCHAFLAEHGMAGLHA